MKSYENYTPEINYAPEPDKKEKQGTTAGTEPSRMTGRKKATAKKQPKPASKKKETNTEPFTTRIKNWATSQNTRLIVGILLGCLAVYLGVSFISYFTDCIKDQSIVNNYPIGRAPAVDNAGGEGGARLAEFLINESFGLGSIVLIFWFAAMSLKLLSGRPRFKSVNFTIKCFVALITLSLIVGLATINLHSPVNWGGYNGRYVNEFILHFVGLSGALLLCVFMLSLFVIICLRDVVNWIIRIRKERKARRQAILEKQLEEEAKARELAEMKKQEEKDAQKAGEALSSAEKEGDLSDGYVSFDSRLYSNGEDDEPLYALPPSETKTITAVTSYGDDAVANDSNDTDTDDTKDSGDIEEPSTDGPDSKSADSTVADSENLRTEEETVDNMVVSVNQIGQSEKQHYKAGEDHRNGYRYAYPPFDLLRPGVEKISVDEDEQIENKDKIEKTLLDFGIPITSIRATVGPTVTLYEIVPDKGVKIAKIRSLVDDIALSLSAIGVRIVAPIPGKGTVGIEVANKDPQTVSMRTVIQSNKFQNSHYELPIALGSTISNDVYIADLAKMPHLLVAGATGQGKSVGLNAIIASLLYCKTPDELKFVMVDPKQVEFSLYAKLKNYYMAMLPEEEECVVTDTNKVEATLNSLCIEMDNRYQLLKMAHVRKITEYNEKIKKGLLNPMEGHKFLPYIVVIVDEFSDLIMMSGKNVETPIARLAQKARAVGMHVIIATQRPSTNVITGIIKANFPARIAFKVSSGVDSKTILDATGAQQLIGRGDMLIINNSETVRVQCAFIDTPEVEQICDYVERQPYPTGPYILPEPIIAGDEDASVHGNNFGERDPLFDEVARLVVQSNTASTSSLQRRYSIGYNRAGKIMDQLEAAGIVGPSQGGKPRIVLVNDMMTLESILGNV